MRHLAILSLFYALTVSAQVPVSIKCSGQAQQFVGPHDSYVLVLQCTSSASCESIAGTYDADWDSMTDQWTEYTSAWSCYD